MKKYIIISLLTVGSFSCSDSFLEEKMVSTITQDYFNTEQGLEQLVIGTYNVHRMKFGWTDGIMNFEAGTDITAVQGGLTRSNYSPNVWHSTGGVATDVNSFMGQYSKQLLGLYPTINNCNRAIETIGEGKGLGKFAKDPEYAAQRMGEAMFNRAMCYYQLVAMLGDVYCTTKSSNEMPANFAFERTPSEEIYKLMISDARYAYDHLPEEVSTSEFGRATQYAAAHFLAKLYLQRAQGAEYGSSEYGRGADGKIDNSNSKSYLGMLYKGNVSTDLDSCIFFATQVINSGKYELESDFGKLFSHPLGDYSNESSKELILSAVFGSGSADNTRFGLRTVAYFAGNYVDALWGIPTYCWEYQTQPSSGVHGNDRAFDIYTNKLADSRFQKSFHLEYKTARMGGGTSSPGENLDYHAYNSDLNKTYVWTEEQADYFNENIWDSYKRESYNGRKAVKGEHKMGSGDLAFAFLENTKATAIDMDEALAQPFVVFARWLKKDGKYYYRPTIQADAYEGATKHGYTNANFYGLETGNHRSGQPIILKYDDPNRTSYNSFYATRDIPVFRLAETYLLRAEAYGRKEGSGSANAIADINKVRTRAAFKTGEQRNEVLARLYPGKENLVKEERMWPYEVRKDMISEMLVDASYWDGASENSKAENYPPTATTDLQRFLHFIYNELAREMNQEFIYSENVRHSGLLADRIIYNNQIASPQRNLWDKADNLNDKGQGQDGNGKGFFEPFNIWRPFPQTFIDQLTDQNGALLDEAGKKAYQNYGY